MALKLDNALLAELGLGALPEHEKQLLLRQIYEKLEMNVGMRLADQMTNEQLDAFEKFVDANDDKGAFQWLETNFPNYKDVVNAEFERLKVEIKQNAPQIIMAIQNSPRPAPMQPMPGQGMQPGMGQPGMQPGMPGTQPGMGMPQPGMQPMSGQPMPGGYQAGTPGGFQQHPGAGSMPPQQPYGAPAQPYQPRPQQYGAPQPGYGQPPSPYGGPQPGFNPPQPGPAGPQPGPQPMPGQPMPGPGQPMNPPTPPTPPTPPSQP